MDPLLAPIALLGLFLIRIGIPAAVIFLLCKCVDRFNPEIETGV